MNPSDRELGDTQFLQEECSESEGSELGRDLPRSVEEEARQSSGLS